MLSTVSAVFILAAPGEGASSMKAKLPVFPGVPLRLSGLFAPPHSSPTLLVSNR